MLTEALFKARGQLKRVREVSIDEMVYAEHLTDCKEC